MKLANLRGAGEAIKAAGQPSHHGQLAKNVPPTHVGRAAVFHAIAQTPSSGKQPWYLRTYRWGKSHHGKGSGSV
jgi:hypothetical protein